MKLVDGITRRGNVLLVKVDVFLHTRAILITFVVIPDAHNCTLLGIEFIIDSKMQLKIAVEH